MEVQSVWPCFVVTDLPLWMRIRNVTRPFAMLGKKLYINADARDGTVRVDILNAHNQVVGGDSVRKELRWKKRDLASLNGEIVAFRLTFHNVQIHSYWVD